MTSGSEDRIRELRSHKQFPEPAYLLNGFFDRSEITDLQRQTIQKIQQLVEEEGSDAAERVMASVMSYLFAKAETQNYNFGHNGLYRKLLTNSFPNKINGYFVDHAYGLKDITNGLEYVILEPYGITSDEIKELLRQCDQNGLSFRISGTSVWYPGRTVQIIIYETKALSEATEKAVDTLMGDKE